MDALRLLYTAGILILPFSAQALDLPPCVLGREGVVEQPSLLFRYDPRVTQRTLVPRPDNVNGWLEVEYVEGAMQLHYRLMGNDLGLPIDVHQMSVELLDRTGHHVWAQPLYFPNPDECGPVALFPRNSSSIIKLPPVTGNTQNYRLLIRLWLNR